jgi:hypothetical protein
VGLLYFPRISVNCSDPSLLENGIPANSVTLDKLPVGFNLIAIIPITTCASDYLIQVERDQTELAVLYNYTSMSNFPPSLTNTSNFFNNPIYGISSDDATPLLRNLVNYSGNNYSGNNYSGNMSTVPFGSHLSTFYDPLDCVRLSLTINNNQSGIKLPPGAIVGIFFGGVIVIVLVLNLVIHRRKKAREPMSVGAVGTLSTANTRA